MVIHSNFHASLIHRTSQELPRSRSGGNCHEEICLCLGGAFWLIAIRQTISCYKLPKNNVAPHKSDAHRFQIFQLLYLLSWPQSWKIREKVGMSKLRSSAQIDGLENKFSTPIIWIHLMAIDIGGPSPIGQTQSTQGSEVQVTSLGRMIFTWNPVPFDDFYVKNLWTGSTGSTGSTQ